MRAETFDGWLSQIMALVLKPHLIKTSRHYYTSFFNSANSTLCRGLYDIRPDSLSPTIMKQTRPLCRLPSSPHPIKSPQKYSLHFRRYISLSTSLKNLTWSSLCWDEYLSGARFSFISLSFLIELSDVSYCSSSNIRFLGDFLGIDTGEIKLEDDERWVT